MRDPGAIGVRAAVTDAVTVAHRNVIALRRSPQLLVFATIQPVVFVLLFRYVFGGAIEVPGGRYVDYLMPGIFVQTVTFGAMGAAIGLATDMKSGLLERFRSLPMARSAVLAGRTLADLARNAFVCVLMVTVGMLVGFRIRNGILAFLAAMGLVLLFGYVVTWIFATVGLTIGDPETAQAASFPVLAPLVFASSAFVPIETMPGWLEAFARHQPVSVTVSAARALILGGPTAQPLIESLVWCAVILAVFVPIAVRRYARAV